MKITINKESLVKNVQDQFNIRYPFLKLEFFKNYSNGKAIPKIERAGANELVKQLPGFVNEGIINIDYKRTVTELENDFKKQIGIMVEVFRRSGNVWIETSLTDDWTLEQQNKEGEQISSHFSERDTKHNW
ncbi:MAG: hypothetical protein WDM71_09405 [Ferruginibacter sp.]